MARREPLPWWVAFVFAGATLVVGWVVVPMILRARSSTYLDAIRPVLEWRIGQLLTVIAVFACLHGMVAWWRQRQRARVEAARQALASSSYARSNVQAPEAANACPTCGADMVRRVRKSDGAAFLGCSRFPACRGTRAL